MFFCVNVKDFFYFGKRPSTKVDISHQVIIN